MEALGAAPARSGETLGSRRIRREHPLRDLLTNEVHARPFAELVAPTRASHIALLTGEGGADEDYEQLVRLCERYAVPPPRAAINHFNHDFGPFRVRWERHTEFVSYTFFRDRPFADPFGDTVIDTVARDWLERLPGELLIAVHVALLPREAPPPLPAELARGFVADSLVGSEVAGGAATVYTDFRIHEDGFGRILLHDGSLGGRRAGRVVQRLLEIETYRMMALLALPPAREAGPEIARVERDLADAVASMTGSEGIENERALLGRLTRLAADIEALAARTSYRFGAARAYASLVDQRVVELKERPMAGLQTITEFMERRFVPAMRTCESVAQRQETLAGRVARASELLRTRVDVALEGQNRDLLRSMNRRARLQLLLQETVEGLSVVAITYYLVGLLSYLGKAGKALLPWLEPDLVAGAALPFALVLVWWSVRRVRRRLMRRDGGNGDA
jgi:uncharacterized membrane-anchored protein